MAVISRSARRGMRFGVLLGLLLSSQGIAHLPMASANGDVGLPNFFDQPTIDYFAPVLEMYHSEDNGPASGKWFLDRADLEFSHEPVCGSQPVWNRGWGDEAISRLGHGGFRVALKEGRDCRPDPRHRFTSSDYTRPYDKGRPAVLGPKQGFYLDVCAGHPPRPACDDRWKGGLGDEVADDHTYQTRAPVYYDDGALSHPAGTPDRAFISYWFFYAYNDGPRPVGLNHQGDWENMSYLFEDSGDGVDFQLKAISFSAHGAPQPIASVFAPRVSWAGNRRYVGYVADGSHATYDTPGKHAIRYHGVQIAYDLTDRVGVGKAWPTWTGLRQLRSQGWAGYCGAWGSVALSVEQLATDRSGPLGPGCLDAAGHQRKTGRPPGWGTSTEPNGDFLTRGPTHRGLDTLPAPSPPSDSDLDGVPDAIDACPTVKGTRSNGCPNPPPTAADMSFVFAVNGGPNAVTYHKVLSASDDRAIAAWSLDWQDFGSASQNFRWNGSGSFDMKPEAMAGTALHFRYHVVDDENAASRQATVTIHVCKDGTSFPCPR